MIQESQRFFEFFILEWFLKKPGQATIDPGRKVVLLANPKIIHWVSVTFGLTCPGLKKYPKQSQRETMFVLFRKSMQNQVFQELR